MFACVCWAYLDIAYFASTFKLLAVFFVFFIPSGFGL